MKLIEIKETNSTNTYAFEQLTKEKVEEWTVYVADNQQQGKGQKGNSWESEPGKNLTLSLVLRPEFLPAMQQYYISKVVCLGLHSMLSKHIDDVKVKWPNDIYVRDKKICGVLIENQLAGVNLRSSICGIGLNVNQSEFRSDAPNPVSMMQLSGQSYDLKEILNELITNIKHWYDALLDGDLEALDDAFSAVMFQKDEWCEYEDENGVYRGMVLGVNEIGQLLILPQGAEKAKEYHFKEVRFILQ